MTSLITQGLIITGIGMGLVFAAIVFLWGLMALMVRMDGTNNGKHESPGSGMIGEALGPSNLDNKKRAAAAAVALALAGRETTDPSAADMAGQESANSWKHAQRAQVLQEKSRIFSHRQDRRS